MKDSDAPFRELVEPRVRTCDVTSYVWRTSGVPFESHGCLGSQEVRNSTWSDGIPGYSYDNRAWVVAAQQAALA